MRTLDSQSQISRRWVTFFALALLGLVSSLSYLGHAAEPSIGSEPSLSSTPSLNPLATDQKPDMPSTSCTPLSMLRMVKSFEDIHPFVRSWILQNEPLVNQPNHPDELLRWSFSPYETYKPGDKIVVEGMEVTLLHVLGAGNEGYTYLVQHREGLMVAKIFHRQRYGLHFEHMKKQNLSEPALILARDPRAEILLLEYLEGIPAHIVLHNDDMCERLGIAVKQREKIRQEWERTQGKRGTFTHNAVYSFKLDMFYKIDAF